MSKKNRPQHHSVAGKYLSRYYYDSHIKRLQAELEHLAERLNYGYVKPPEDFERLVADVASMRRKMVGLARRRGTTGTYKSHYWAWFYTTEERRKQNLALGYNCTMDMAHYRQLDLDAGNRVS